MYFIALWSRSQSIFIHIIKRTGSICFGLAKMLLNIVSYKFCKSIRRSLSWLFFLFGGVCFCPLLHGHPYWLHIYVHTDFSKHYCSSSDHLFGFFNGDLILCNHTRLHNHMKNKDKIDSLELVGIGLSSLYSKDKIGI